MGLPLPQQPVFPTTEKVENGNKTKPMTQTLTTSAESYQQFRQMWQITKIKAQPSRRHLPSQRRRAKAGGQFRPQVSQVSP
jgi:hypothetical protein